jgi:sarcosine oxidase
MTAYDVIVLGTGGMGSAAAAHLARRGTRVLGLERYGPAHALGSSHGGSRVYRQSYFEDPAYVPLLLRAWDLWQELGPDCFTATGGLYAGRPDGTTFGGSLRAAREWDLPHQVLDPAETAHRFPTFRLRPDELALYEQRAGFARPEATVTAHLARAAAAGADLRFGEPALDWSATGTGVRVRTAAGTYTAGALVLSPGAWAPQLAGLPLPMVVERQIMHWVAPSGPVDPWVDHPVYIVGDGPRQVYGFPALDGPGGGVKLAFFRAGAPADPDTVDRTVRPEEMADLRTRAREFFPGLDGPTVRAVVCMYTTTPDEHFVLGRHPGHDNVAVAAGFSGHGFKFVPVVGEILADLALDGSTRHPIDLFDPRRPGAAHHGPGRGGTLGT